MKTIYSTYVENPQIISMEMRHSFQKIMPKCLWAHSDQEFICPYVYRSMRFEQLLYARSCVTRLWKQTGDPMGGDVELTVSWGVGKQRDRGQLGHGTQSRSYNTTNAYKTHTPQPLDRGNALLGKEHWLRCEARWELLQQRERMHIPGERRPLWARWSGGEQSAFSQLHEKLARS